MSKADEFGKRSRKGGDIGCGVEERRVLLDEEVRHFRSAIFTYFLSAEGIRQRL